MKLLGFTTGLLTCLAISVSATTRYVDVNCVSPTSPYTSWPTAATNIQDAIDVANAGDHILVTNGVYETGGRAVYGRPTNRIALDKAVTVESISGPSLTVIKGYYDPNNGVRCAYMTNGAMLVGFTLTNGTAIPVGNGITNESGAGVWCESRNSIISNCVITGNAAQFCGGGAYQGTLFNCILSSNSAFLGGGGYSNALINCTLVKNLSNLGGGAYSCLLSNCFLVSNRTTIEALGGGAFSSTLDSCVLSNNVAAVGGAVLAGSLNNCFISGNFAYYYGGGAAGFPGSGTNFECTLNNCVLVDNRANQAGGGAYQSTLNNCIIYYNYPGGGSNYYGSVLNYCCTTPLPAGLGNFTNEPLFADLAGGDLRLQSNSPCINAGKNASAPAGPDLDGNSRIAGGTVDIGAYEYQTPSSVLSYAWAQQYGLLTDGSADFAHNDTDGMNNWQEWKADTNPTDSQSILRMTSLSNGLSGVLVQWQSTNSRAYFLERAADLPTFSALASNIVGQAFTTTYTDTTATNGGPFFYRVGVQE